MINKKIKFLSSTVLTTTLLISSKSVFAKTNQTLISPSNTIKIETITPQFTNWQDDLFTIVYKGGCVQRGDVGTSVAELQFLLNWHGYNLTQDGVFGSATQNAVQNYQSRNNLSVDGICGINTARSLIGSYEITWDVSTNHGLITDINSNIIYKNY